MQSNFHLEKWYMDVVTEDAEVLILYFARLTWKKFSFTYSGHIHRNSKSEVTRKNSFTQTNSPEWNGSNLKWNTSFLKASWKAIDAPIQSSLLRNDTQFIHWNCTIPKGIGKARIEDATVEGLGYAEKMTLNILPWQLPIKELFWGRFLSKDYSVIWIEWRGSHPKFCVWLNGKLYETGAISNECIQVDGLLVSFESKFELRAGHISDTIFKGVRKIMSLFPRSIFQLNENKWCGVAKLTITEREQINGTYIHEHVIWA